MTLVVVSLLNIAMSAAALIVVLTRPAGPPNYTTAQRTEANAQLCDRYRLAISAVRIDTHGGNSTLGSIALTNGAFMLEAAAAEPAVDSQYRGRALALATALETMNARASVLPLGDPGLQDLIDGAQTKSDAMRQLCSG